MPKVKKSNSKHIDFQKTKTKLGSSKKGTPSNATSTSFSAKSIALPRQSLRPGERSEDAQRRSPQAPVQESRTAATLSISELRTRRNLTLEDLIVQMNHYSPKTREDALSGIKELLNSHPPLLLHRAADIFPSIARLLSDEDSSVRRVLYSTLSLCITSDDIPTRLLLPYARTILLHTTSALSHIFSDVRVDALGALNLCLLRFPDLVVRDWQRALLPMSTADSSFSFSTAADSHGPRVLQCYLALLGISPSNSSTGHTPASSTFSTDLSTRAKLTLFNSLCTFIEATHTAANEDKLETSSASRPKACSSTPSTHSFSSAGTNENCPVWFFAAYFSNPSSWQEFVSFARSDLSASQAHSQVVLREEGTSVLPRDDVFHDLGAPSSFQHPGEFVDTDSDFPMSTTATLDELRKDIASHLPSGAHVSISSDNYQSERGTKEENTHLRLFSLLHPLLLATFLDSAPTAFSPSPAAGLEVSSKSTFASSTVLTVEASLVCAIARLTLLLWRGALNTSTTLAGDASISCTPAQREELSSLLVHMAPYFPFGQKDELLASMSSRYSSNAQPQLDSLNQAYCELVALLALSEEQQQKQKLRKGKDKQDSIDYSHIHKSSNLQNNAKHASSSRGNARRTLTPQALETQLRRVGRYVVDILQYAGDPTTVNISATALSVEAYSSLLPTAWILLNSTTASALSSGSTNQKLEQQEFESPDITAKVIIDALIAHFERIPVLNPLKRISFEFLARLCRLHKYQFYTGSFRIRPSSPFRSSFQYWINSLPRVLWELRKNPKKESHGPDSMPKTISASQVKHSNLSAPDLNEIVIEFLRLLACEADGIVLGIRDVEALQRFLVPLFRVAHPSRGMISGPYQRLSDAAQRRVKGLLFYLEPLESSLADAAVWAGAR